MTLVKDTLSEAWTAALTAVELTGLRTAPRGMETRELLWQQVIVGDPMTFPVKVMGREFRNVIGVLEALSLVGQFSVPELFTSRVKRFNDFTDDGTFHGAYGARAHGALGDVVHLLERDPDSRQAVISVFDSSRDLDRKKRDIPCTISMQFMLRDNELDLSVTMRSNDVWLGTPYDFTQFAVAQASVAQALGVETGLYVHNAGSLHLYERDAEAAADVLAAEESHTEFPLWHANTIGDISKRARDLAFGVEGFMPVTQFEAWAWTELHG